MDSTKPVFSQLSDLKKVQQKKKDQLQQSKIKKQEDDESDENEEGQENKKDQGEKKKKKKKKKNKKKNKNKDNQQSLIPQIQQIPLEELTAETQTNQRFRCLGGWPKPIKIKFPNNSFNGYPANQLQQYKVPRVKTQETKAKDLLIEEHLQFLRKGAEIQRQVRRFAQKIIKPGRKLIDICQQIQTYNRKLAPQNGLLSGIAFPTGCSLNHVAAHYTPNPGDNTIITNDDVCKIDFGTHINGRIIDTAFCVAFNPTFDKLLEAVKDATNTGIKQAGIDVRICDIGALIQETMESYEVEIKGKVYPVRVVRNLNGHSIQPYKIHAGKTVPCIKASGKSVVAGKMEEGECYAIETFGTTGKGIVKEDGDCSHYMKDFHLPANVKIPARSKAFYNMINQKYDTLCFCKRWLEKCDIPAYILPLKDLVQNGIINTYPPLCDVEGSYVAQWEHTFLLRPTCKEILSRGDDY